MKPEELVDRYPRLHHMAESGSWPAIQRLGLMTTKQIVDACAPDQYTREAILCRRRAKSYTLHHPVWGPVTIRDQGPLLEHNLGPALIDMTVREWLDVLNTRVFFWLHPRRLDTLLAAKRYRDSIHDVLVLDTAELLARYTDEIRIASMNTGAAIFPNAVKRGSETFMTVDDFPFDKRRHSKAIHNNAVELAVTGRVPDVGDLALRVEKRRGAETVDVLYERPLSDVRCLFRGAYVSGRRLSDPGDQEASAGPEQ